MDFEVMENMEDLKGKLTVKLEGGNCEIAVKGNFHSFSMMVGNLIASFYSHLLDNANEELEDPEKEMRESIHKLVDISIDMAEERRLLENLSQKAKNAKSSLEIIELLGEAAKIIREAHAKGIYVFGGTITPFKNNSVVFEAFEKVPDALWEEEYNKYIEVLNKYKDIRVLRWTSN